MTFTNWVRNRNRAYGLGDARKPMQRPRLGMELLEDRTTPTISANLNAGVLTVALSGNDNATVGGLASNGTTIAVSGNGFPQQNFSNVTSIVVNDTSGGGATNQRVGFDTVGGTSLIGITGSVTVTGIETIALNSLSNPMTANSGITFTGASVVNTINTLPQLSSTGAISITATGGGDAIGTAANPIRIAAGGLLLTTNTTVGNGNQFFDFGGGFVNVNVPTGPINAGTGTVTLTNGEFFGVGNGSDFGDSTTFNLGTGGILSVGAFTETIGGLSGIGTVGVGQNGPRTLVVGNNNATTTFAGTLVNVSPGNGASGVLTVQKIGTGTLALTGNNTYTGTTTISGGVLQLGNGGTSGSLGSGSIANNANLTVNRSDALTINSTISGSGTLLKTGGGTLTLTGNNSYGGGTTISAGGIHFTTSTALGSGTVTLGDANTALGVDPFLLAAAAGNTTLANNVLINDDGAVIGSVDNAAGPNATFSGTITNNGTAAGQLFLLGGSSDRTTFTGQITGSGSFLTIIATAAGRRVVLDNATANANNFTGLLTIENDAVLQLGLNTANPQIPDTAVVAFTNAGSTLQLFQMNETVGSLRSDAAGAGLIRSFGGNTVLTIGANDADDAFSGVIQNNVGTIAMVKTGTGTQTLSGVNTHTGGTTINGGTLLVNGTHTAVGATTTATGGGTALGGSGIIAGAVSIQNGAGLLPGNTTTNATLGTGNLTIQPGASTLGVKLSTAGGALTSDQANVTGTVNIAGANLFALAQNSTLPLGTSFTILNNDGTDAIVGTFAGLAEGAEFIPANGTQSYRISYVGGTGNDITLTVSAGTLPAQLVVTGAGVGTGQLFTPNLAGTYGVGSTQLLIPGFGGEIRVATADVNGDGIFDTIAATGPGGDRIRVLSGNGGAVLADFSSFGGYGGGVFVAAGDLNGDGRADIAVTGDAPDAFSGPQANGLQVRVFDGASMTNGTNTPTLMANFNGLASLNGAQGEGQNVRLGGRPAIADVNGDGRLDLAIAAGSGGGPRVCVWNGLGFANANGGRPTVNPIANLFVFESRQRGGAFLTAGDITGDNRAEIIVGGGPGGGPRLRIVDSALLLTLPNLEAVDLDDPVNLTNGLVLNNFFAGSAGNRGGVHLTVRDVDNDGRADVVTGSGTNEPSLVRVYRATALAAVFGTNGEPANPQIIDPFGAVIAGGVWVG